MKSVITFEKLKNIPRALLDQTKAQWIQHPFFNSFKQDISKSSQTRCEAPSSNSNLDTNTVSVLHTLLRNMNPARWDQGLFTQLFDSHNSQIEKSQEGRTEKCLFTTWFWRWEEIWSTYDQKLLLFFMYWSVPLLKTSKLVIISRCCLKILYVFHVNYFWFTDLIFQAISATATYFNITV